MAGERTAEPRATFTLRSGLAANLRCLRPDDADLLGAYFARLSPQTMQMYAPHRFDRQTADRLCMETRTDTEVVRIVVTVPEGDGPRIIAYFMIAPLSRRFAPRPESTDRAGCTPSNG